MLFKDSLIFVFFISSSEINFEFFRFNFPLKLRFIFLSNAVNSKSFSPKTFFCNESLFHLCQEYHQQQGSFQLAQAKVEH